MRLLAAILLFPSVAWCSDWAPVVPEDLKAAIEKPFTKPTGQNRYPALHLLNRFRATRLVRELGGKRYQVSLQMNRTDTWHLVLLPEGGNVHEPEAVIPMRAFRDGRKEEVAGRLWSLSLTGPAHDPSAVFADASGALVEVRVADAEAATYESAAPVYSMGPEWRLLYQIEVWDAAGARSLVFMEKEGEFVLYHIVGIEGVDWTREVFRQAGKRKIALSFDDEGRLVVRPVEPAE